MVDISGRRETAGTAPAWQVRESQRQKFLKGITQKIYDYEDKVGRINLLRLLLYIVDKKLVTGQVTVNKSEFTNVPPNHMTQILALFSGISKSIRKFQRSETEGYALFAKILEWAAGEIAQRHYSELLAQQDSYPEVIYGAKRATDEVPLA